MSTAPKSLKYLVKERSLIGNTIHEEGTEVFYDGLPAENLEPTCDEGRARYQEYLDSNAARVRLMLANNENAPPQNDAAAFAAAVGEAVAEANAQHAASQAALLASLEAMKVGQNENIAAAVASAIAQVFPNGTAKKAVVPDETPIA